MVGSADHQNNGRILVVDDDPDIVHLIEFYLKRQGYAVSSAGSGRDALAVCDRQVFDLAILDVMMPGMDGLELCRLLRERERTANLPIMMLSSLSQVQHKVQGLRAGSDEYVTKPIDLEELGARVATLLDRTRRLMQARPSAQGKVFAVLGAKGGVGATTVALNLASALVQTRKSVIAIELRPGYGSFAHQLKNSPRANLAQLLELDPLRIDERQLRACLAPTASGFSAVFAPQAPEEYRRLTPETAEAVVRVASGLADYTVLELPAWPHDALPGAVRLADLLVLVLEADPGCIHAARAAVDMLRLCGIGPSLIHGVLVNRSGLPMNLTPNDVRAQLGCELLGSIPRAAEMCQAAQERGTTLVAFKPDHLAASTFIGAAGKLATEPAAGVRV